MNDSKRNILIVLVGMVAAMLLFSACANDDLSDWSCTYPVVNSTIGTFVEESDDSYYIDSDKGNKFYVENYQKMLDDGCRPGQRVYAEFYSQIGNERPYVGRITVGLTSVVPVRDVVALEESMGDDPMDVVNIWNTKNYLNVQYLILVGGTYAHGLDLVTVESPKRGEEGYKYLELRHSLNGDSQLNNKVGIMSFDISRYLADVDLKGFIIKVNRIGVGETFLKYDIDR